MLAIIKKCLPKIKAILDSVTQQELKWASYLFSEGRAVLGLNETLLSRYSLHMAEPLYKELGVPFDFESVPVNPLKYVEKYIDPSQMQSAAQEIQITDYAVGAITDDSEGLDLTDLF